MVTLAPLLYGKVVGRFLAIIGDGVDADTSPDAVPIVGTVTFTPSPAAILVTSATPDPATILPTPVVASLDSNGYLTFNGVQGVYLLATNDTSMNPTAWTWQARFSFTYAGTALSYGPFSFALPSGGTVDLTTVAPAPTSNGVSTGGVGTWGSINGTLTAQTDLGNALALKATLASPTFTGDPKVPTPATSDNDLSVANTAWVNAAIATAVAAALNTIPYAMVPVEWNTSTNTWQYNGTTISARPSNMRAGDNIEFIGTGDVGSGPALPSWKANGDVWDQG